MREANASGAPTLSPRAGRGRFRGKSVVAALIALASPALAAPRTIDDCEAIKDPNAYNLCLASFGPVRGQHGANYPGVASEGDRRGAAPATARSGGRSEKRQGATHGWTRGAGVAHRGGRIRMEFTPGRCRGIQ